MFCSCFLNPATFAAVDTVGLTLFLMAYCSAGSQNASRPIG